MRAYAIYIGIVLACMRLIACAKPLPPEPTVVSVEAKERVAEATYSGQLLACVEAHRSRAAIDACADGVRARWSSDGGAQ